MIEWQCALAVAIGSFLADASCSEKIDIHTITYQKLVYAYPTLIVFKFYVAEALYSDSRNMFKWHGTSIPPTDWNLTTPLRVLYSTRLLVMNVFYCASRCTGCLRRGCALPNYWVLGESSFGTLQRLRRLRGTQGPMDDSFRWLCSVQMRCSSCHGLVSMWRVYRMTGMMHSMMMIWTVGCQDNIDDMDSWMSR